MVDTDIPSMAQPINVVCFRMWHHQKIQYLEDLGLYQVLLAPIVNDEMELGTLHPNM